MAEANKIIITKETTLKLNNYVSGLKVASMRPTRKGFWDIADDYIIGQNSEGGAVIRRRILTIYPMEGDEKWVVSYKIK